MLSVRCSMGKVGRTGGGGEVAGWGGTVAPLHRFVCIVSHVSLTGRLTFSCQVGMSLTLVLISLVSSSSHCSSPLELRAAMGPLLRRFQFARARLVRSPPGPGSACASGSEVARACPCHWRRPQGARLRRRRQGPTLWKNSVTNFFKSLVK